MVLDVHCQVNILSKQLQKESLLFSEIQPLFDATIAGLKNMCESEGNNEKDIIQNLNVSDTSSTSLKGVELTNYSESVVKNFKKLKEKYISSLIRNIENRFEQNSSKILGDLGMVFEPSHFDVAMADNAIQDLGEHYGSDKVTSIIWNSDSELENTDIPSMIDKEKLKDEWPLMKGMVTGAYQKMNTKQLCKRLITLHCDMMPNIAKLAHVALSMCVTSVDCERNFSLQNRLKSKYRCSLKPESVNNLMKINLLGPPLQDFNVASVVKLWHGKKKRRLSRLSQPKKPRLSFESK